MTFDLADLGITAVQLAAGFAGGLMKAIVTGAGTIGGYVTSCIAGALTAAYLTPIAAPFLAKWLDVTSSIEPTTGFFVGLTATAICENIIARARAKLGGANAPT
jgi:fructose-specific phosphotransferase system IIC component